MMCTVIFPQRYTISQLYPSFFVISLHIGPFFFVSVICSFCKDNKKVAIILLISIIFVFL